MSYFANCGKCDKEIYHEDYRGQVGDLDYYFCRDCMYEIQEEIVKYLDKVHYEKKNR